MQTRATITGSVKWRRGWDSNPRTRLGVTHFPGVRLRPLGHLSSRSQGYRSGTGDQIPTTAAGGLVRGRRLVARRNVVASIVGPGRRRRVGHGRDDQCACGIRRIEPSGHFQRRRRQRVLILLCRVAIRVQFAEKGGSRSSKRSLQPTPIFDQGSCSLVLKGNSGGPHRAQHRLVVRRCQFDQRKADCVPDNAHPRHRPFDGYGIGFNKQILM